MSEATARTLTPFNVNSPARLFVVTVQKKIILEISFLIEDFAHFSPTGLEYITAEQKQF